MKEPPSNYPRYEDEIDSERDRSSHTTEALDIWKMKVWGCVLEEGGAYPHSGNPHIAVPREV